MLGMAWKGSKKVDFLEFFFELCFESPDPDNLKTRPSWPKLEHTCTWASLGALRGPVTAIAVQGPWLLVLWIYRNKDLTKINTSMDLHG